MSAVQVVGAIRDRDDHRSEKGPREQEAQDLSGGLVGPVRVLDDQQRGRSFAGRLQDGVDGLEQLSAVQTRARRRVRVTRPRQQSISGLEPGERRSGVEHPGDDGGQLRTEAADHLGERQVRQGVVAEVKTVTDHDLPAGVPRAVGDLAQQPCLPDSGVAVDEHDRRGSGRRQAGRSDAEKRTQPTRLILPAHQRDRGSVNDRHAAHDGPFGRRRGTPVPPRRRTAAARGDCRAGLDR